MSNVNDFLKLSQETQRFVSSYNVPDLSRSLITSIAVAKVIAYELTLPSSRVDNLRAYYRNNIGVSESFNHIDMINNWISLDVDKVNEIIYEIYSFRYNTAFGSAKNNATYVSHNRCVSEFLGVACALNAETLKAIDEKGQDINLLVINIDKLLTEIR